MKRIVLDTPVPIFVLGIFLPYILTFSSVSFPFMIHILLIMLPTITTSLWVISVAEYVREETQSDRFVLMIYLVELFQIALMADYAFHLGLIDFIHLPFVMRFAFFNLVIGVLLALNIKKLFTGRTLWWIIIELAFPVIGVWTLTSEIQEWDKTKKDISGEDVLDL